MKRQRVDDPPAGDARLILAVKHHQENQRMEAELARITLETGGDLPVNPQALPGDEAKLRGIPVAMRGVSGVMPGTSPEQETLARERRRLRHWE